MLVVLYGIEAAILKYYYMGMVLRNGKTGTVENIRDLDRALSECLCEQCAMLVGMRYDCWNCLS